MLSQKVNRYSKNSHKNCSVSFPLGHGPSKPVKDQKTGFIHHPRGYPMEVKRLWWERRKQITTEESSSIGVMFESEKYIKPGTRLEITVPMRKETEKFRGQVVLVCADKDKYNIGIWLSHRADASRARIVEQVCHIENYLKEKKYRDGPYSINREKIAEEWIINNASKVPSI